MDALRISYVKKVEDSAMHGKMSDKWGFQVYDADYDDISGGYLFYCLNQSQLTGAQL